MTIRSSILAWGIPWLQPIGCKETRLSKSLTLTHTHTHTYTHPYTQTPTHTLLHTHTPYTHSPTHTHTPQHTHTPLHTHTPTHTHTHSPTWMLIAAPLIAARYQVLTWAAISSGPFLTYCRVPPDTRVPPSVSARSAVSAPGQGCREAQGTELRRGRGRSLLPSSQRMQRAKQTPAGPRNPASPVVSAHARPIPRATGTGAGGLARSWDTGPWAAHVLSRTASSGRGN